MFNFLIYVYDMSMIKGYHPAPGYLFPFTVKELDQYEL